MTVVWFEQDVDSTAWRNHPDRVAPAGRSSPGLASVLEDLLGLWLDRVASVFEATNTSEGGLVCDGALEREEESGRPA